MSTSLLIRNVAPAILLCGALLATGCVMPDQMSQMQKDMADMQLQLRRVEREQTDAETLLSEISSKADSEDGQAGREEMADLTLRVEQVLRQMAIADERINDLNRRLDRYSADLQQTREIARRGGSSGPSYGTPSGPSEFDPTRVDPSLPAPNPGGGEAIPDPEALYNTAYADFSKGNFSLAISGFEEYHERFPESALADNALYWVGECHFSQGDYPVAIRSFDRLLGEYPASDKAAAGNLKKALAYMEQNQIGKAIIQFRFVASSYDGSDEARIAKEKLVNLGAEP